MTADEDDYELLGNIDVAEAVFGMQLPRGEVLLRTHGPDKCAGEFCCIHNPSDHPLREARLNWRADRYLMERVCKHGVGHPDPDDLAHKRQALGIEFERYAFGVHGCDGCCRD